MAAVSIGISPESSKQFNNLLREMVKVTGRSMKIVIRNSARDFTRIAIQETPQAGRTITGALVKTRGFAKSGWVLAAIALGNNKSRTHQRGGRQGLRFGDFKNGLNKPQTPFFVITNSVPYIEELPGAILQRTINRVSLQMQRTLTRESRRLWRSTWKR